MKKFENVIDYAKSNFNTFEVEGPNEVDSVIFCWLCYLYIHKEFSNSDSAEGMPISGLLKAEYYDEMFKRVWSVEKTYELLIAVVSSPRYRNIKIRFYRNEMDDETSLQFSAVVFSLSEECHYIAFRGTDWTVTGWKENCLLAIEEPAGAQKLAVDYVNMVGETLPGEIIIGGHSKGGTIAVYSASHCKPEYRNRISAVYSHDGPGVLKSNLEEEGFIEIQERIHKTIPKSSYFGMLFECESKAKIIQSRGISVAQHNLLTWRVKDGKLYEVPERSIASVATVKKLNKWINSMNNEERVTLIHSIFEVMDDIDIKTIDELKSKNVQYIPQVISAIYKKKGDKRRFLLHALDLITKG